MNSYLEVWFQEKDVVQQFLAETEAQKQKSQLTFKKVIVATTEYARWSIKGDKNHRK